MTDRPKDQSNGAVSGCTFKTMIALKRTAIPAIANAANHKTALRQSLISAWGELMVAGLLMRNFRNRAEGALLDQPRQRGTASFVQVPETRAALLDDFDEEVTVQSRRFSHILDQCFELTFGADDV
jgi:hypothetical protein